MTATTSIGQVQQFIRRTGRLYSLPAVAMEVLRLSSEPRVDVRAFKECIERDPALTTRILRVVNSSLFGASRQITDLNQALALIGTRPLRMLVLGFSLPKELFTGIEADVLSRYWRRTLIKAVAARELSERLWRLPGDEAFTAGLVQDIGVLALVQQLGQPYLQFLDLVQDRGGNVLEQELDTFGFDHVILSARLLGHWGLPAPLCAAVSVPPDEARIAELSPAEQTLPKILHLAELMARLLEQPFGPSLRQLLATGGRYRGLTYETLKPIFAALQKKVTELAEVLSLDLPGGQSYADLLIASQQRLADETAVAVTGLLSNEPEAELLELTARLRSEMDAATGNSGKTTVLLRPAAAKVASPEAAVVARGTDRPRPAAGPPGASLDFAADPALMSVVSGAIQRSRQARCSVGLALFSIDRYGDLLLQYGPARAADLIHWLKVELGNWTGQRSPARLIGETCYALVWENCSRSDAVQLVRQVLERARQSQHQRAGNHAKLTLSAGLATLEVPPRNYEPQQLIDAAQRCLSGAQLSGGDTLKSIAF